jgi:hypothetical protein
MDGWMDGWPDTEMTLPAGAREEGYDCLIWEEYFLLFLCVCARSSTGLGTWEAGRRTQAVLKYRTML